MKNQMFFTRAVYFSLISFYFYLYRIFMAETSLSFVSYIIMLAAFLLINFLAKGLNNFRLKKSYSNLEQVDYGKFLNKDLRGMSNTMRFIYYASFIFIVALSWEIVYQWYGFIYVVGIMGILEYFFNRSQPQPPDQTQSKLKTQSQSRTKATAKTKAKAKTRNKK